ncbi:MAG: hypothetical protein ABI076_12525 [Acidobacteriaceae bacterium]
MDCDPYMPFIALRRIAQSKGGIAKVANAARIERETLYLAVSTPSTMG